MSVLNFKKTNYIQIPSQRPVESVKKPSSGKKESLWMKCDACGEMLLKEDVKQHQYTCYKCGKYFRLRARARLKLVADPGSMEFWDEDVQTSDPLQFPGYREKLKALQEKSKMQDAVLTGKCTIAGKDAVLCICDGSFLMGSMGYVVGEKITRAVERATDGGLPVVIFACSGGARMQEGMVSLMQMAKTSAALKKHAQAGLFYLSILTDPTTGGVTASYAMQGDIILAEPGALIGFAGPRVIEQTIRQKLPEGFQRAEFLVEHGLIDGIIRREDMRETVAQLILMHEKPETVRPETTETARPAEPETVAQLISMHEKPETARPETSETAQYETPETARPAEPETVAQLISMHEEPETARPAEPKKGKCADVSAPVFWGKGKYSTWQRVEIARSMERPTALDYIGELFSGFYELHGDRRAKDDSAMVGGIAWFRGRPVTVIGQQKGRNTKENIYRNFGMPAPEGYVKALRLMKQAEKFGRPVITFIDTPGAFCGMEAEEHGQGQAIAQNLFEMAGLTVPILSIVIGEGGSGGALALGVGNEVWMMENATYSVLSPEGFASILWKDASRASEAAEVMKMTAADLYGLRIIDDVIEEEQPADLANLKKICAKMKEKIQNFIEAHENMSKEEIVHERQERFRRM